MKKSVIVASLFVILGIALVLAGVSLREEPGNQKLKKIADYYNRLDESSSCEVKENSIILRNDWDVYLYELENETLSSNASLGNEKAAEMFLKLVNAISRFNKGTVEAASVLELNAYHLEQGLEKKSLEDRQLFQVKTTLRLNANLLVSRPLDAKDFLSYDKELRGTASISLRRGAFYFQKNGNPDQLEVYLGEQKELSDGMYQSLMNLIHYIYGEDIYNIVKAQYPTLQTATIGWIHITVDPPLDDASKERYQGYQMVLLQANTGS